MSSMSSKKSRRPSAKTATSKPGETPAAPATITSDQPESAAPITAEPTPAPVPEATESTKEGDMTMGEALEKFTPEQANSTGQPATMRKARVNLIHFFKEKKVKWTGSGVVSFNGHTAAISGLGISAGQLRDRGEITVVPLADREMDEYTPADDAALERLFQMVEAHRAEMAQTTGKDKRRPEYNKHNRPRQQSAAPIAPKPAEPTQLDRIADSVRFLTGLAEGNKNKAINYGILLGKARSAQSEAQKQSELAKVKGEPAPDLAELVEEAEEAARKAGLLRFECYRDRLGMELNNAGLGLDQEVHTAMLRAIGEIDELVQAGKLRPAEGQNQLFERVDKTLSEHRRGQQRSTFIPRERDGRGDRSDRDGKGRVRHDHSARF